MPHPQDLSGKTYVVTGANSGIGFAAAMNFASRGATVAMVCRSETRGREAAFASDEAAEKLWQVSTQLIAPYL